MTRHLFALLLVALLAAGCASSAARKIIAAQAPGTATGAGATLTGPANSATPTTQTAERTIAFHVPAIPVPQPTVPVIAVAAPGDSAPPPPAAPVWLQEKTTTTIGQHQDAAELAKVVAGGKPLLWWLGLACVATCLGGLLWSHGNPEGYPLVFWKVGGCGVAFMLVGDNPAWLFLLLLPLGFYAVQKLNLLRLP